MVHERDMSCGISCGKAVIGKLQNLTLRRLKVRFWSLPMTAFPHDIPHDISRSCTTGTKPYFGTPRDKVTGKRDKII